MVCFHLAVSQYRTSCTSSPLWPWLTQNYLISTKHWLKLCEIGFAQTAAHEKQLESDWFQLFPVSRGRCTHAYSNNPPPATGHGRIQRLKPRCPYALHSPACYKLASLFFILNLFNAQATPCWSTLPHHKTHTDSWLIAVSDPGVCLFSALNLKISAPYISLIHCLFSQRHCCACHSCLCLGGFCCFYKSHKACVEGFVPGPVNPGLLKVVDCHLVEILGYGKSPKKKQRCKIWGFSCKM